MNEIIIGLKVIIAICALTAGYCAFEIYQDWKESKRLDRLTDSHIRRGMEQARKWGWIKR